LTTKLRTLFDECMTAPLVKLLEESSSALNIEKVGEIMPGAKDPDVMRYASQEHRIVVTTETGINHRKFKICTHPGIIVLAGRRRHESMQAKAFRKFMLSGHRAKANHAVVYISQSEARILSVNGEETIPFE
jgi:predicted nuclease of predicted toxin-antitoxin system